MSDESFEPNEIIILIALYRTGVLNFADIRKLIGKGKLTSASYADSFIYSLKMKNLIIEKKYKRYRFFELTEKGKKVASRLSKTYG